MLQFIEYTWFLWWMFAWVGIFRWFHVLCRGSALGELHETTKAETKLGSASGDQFPLSA